MDSIAQVSKPLRVVHAEKQALPMNITLCSPHMPEYIVIWAVITNELSRIVNY